MARGGATKTRDAPERRCLVTGESGGKAGLIRFVTGPEGQVVPDVLGKLPGRGYYVTADRATLEAAVKKRIFSKGAKAQVAVPEGLVAEVERQQARRVVDLLAMARKAGLALAGFEKVRGALATQNVKALFQAADGSERGKGKLWTPEGARWFGILSADELGMAFGRTRVIHGAVLAGGLTARVVEEAAKLKGLRDLSGNGASGAGKE
ncbi:MAG: RNA-binding protein [Pseudomonadota bacterium]